MQHFHKVLVGIAVFSCVFAALFFLGHAMPRSCGAIAVADDDGLKFNIDKVSKKAGFVRISGWAFHPGRDIDLLRTVVALKSADGLHILNTNIVDRKDVTKAFAGDAPRVEDPFINPFRKGVIYSAEGQYLLGGPRLLYDRAGFEASAPTVFLRSGKYMICLVYTFGGKTLLYETGRSITV